jgi:hypothetical protein
MKPIIPVLTLFSLILFASVATAQPCTNPNTGADNPTNNGNCDGIVNASEIGDYIQQWYACSSCVTDIYNAMAEFFAVCGDNTCNFNEDCSSCQQDCGSCTTPPPIASFPQDYVAYWKFEGDASDETGNNNGILTGSPQYVPGKHGQALDFSGSGEYVTVPVSNSPLNITGSHVTIMAWINYNVGVNVAHIAGVEENAGPPYGNQYKIFMRGSDSGRFFVGTTNGLGGCNGNVNFPANTWTHVAAVYDGSSAKLYIDGVLDISNPHAGNITSNGEDFGIGGGAAGSTEFNGLIDEVMVFNRSLNQTEIQQIIDATSMCAGTSNCPSLTCMNLAACDPQQVGGHDYYIANGCGYDYLPQTAGCDDSDACTSSDSCDGSGNCTGTTITCDDSVACTDDSCNSLTGCVYTPNDANCGSGEQCDSIQGCVNDPCSAITDCSHYTDQINCSANACGVRSICEWNTSTSACEAGDWVAPIGIPYPKFGISETVDMYVGKQYTFTDSRGTTDYPISPVTGDPYTHFVDNSSSSCNDNNAGSYGNATHPRCNIPVNLAKGSVVEIHGGPYTRPLMFDWFYGTPSQPIFIRGDPANKAVSGVPFKVRYVSNLIIENIDFDGATGVGMAGEAHNISVRFCDIHDRPWRGSNAGIGITPSLGMTISNVVIYNNSIYKLGDHRVQSPSGPACCEGGTIKGNTSQAGQPCSVNTSLPICDQDFHGINPNLWNRDKNTELHSVWIVDNHFYQLSGNGVQVNCGTWNSYGCQKYLHHIYIGRNLAHDNRQAGFASKGATHVIMSENTVYRGVDYGHQEMDGIIYQYSPHNLWIMFNDLYDNDFGIRQSGGVSFANHTSYIIGNRIHDCHQGTATHWGSPQGWGIALWQGNGMIRYIIGNTIYNCQGGIELLFAPKSTIVENNIVANISRMYNGQKHKKLHHIGIDRSDTADRSYFDNNLFYQPVGSPTFRWKGSNYLSLSAWQGVSGQCANCIDDDPIFADLASGDIHLQQGSPAIDNATISSVYDTFEQLYGIDIRKDIEGRSRPQDGDLNGTAEWDIGAYEY